MTAPEHLTEQLDAALANYTAGIDCAVRFVTIDQVDMLAEFYLRNRRADIAAAQPAQVCPECSNTGLRDTGGVYPWGEGIFVACDHDDPQPISNSADLHDPRDEVIKGLVEAATDAAEAIDMAYGSDDDESPHRHSAKLRAALAAAKAVQHG